MQQFTVPQFIDVEDKIIGSITTRQFMLLLADLIWCVLAYRLFYFSTFLIIAVVSSLIIGIVAFVKINGRPFHFFILNFVQTLRKPKIRVWNHEDLTIAKDEAMKEGTSVDKLPPVKVKRYSKSRLNELSLIVDTRGVYKGEENDSGARISSINNQITV